MRLSKIYGIPFFYVRTPVSSLLINGSVKNHESKTLSGAYNSSYISAAYKVLTSGYISVFWQHGNGGDQEGSLLFCLRVILGDSDRVIPVRFPPGEALRTIGTIGYDFLRVTPGDGDCASDLLFTPGEASRIFGANVCDLTIVIFAN